MSLMTTMIKSYRLSNKLLSISYNIKPDRNDRNLIDASVMKSVLFVTFDRLYRSV